MNTKEKAAAYDRALEVLHKYEGAHIMLPQDLKEEMFPELKKEMREERIKNGIILILREASLDTLKKSGTCFDEAVSWLEELYKKQKVNEWSVEDESNINHILNFLNYPKLITSAHTQEILKECIAWLLSRKSNSNRNWKPSDEQIEAMVTLMVNLNKNPLLLDNYTQANLRLLYEDLKKL